MKIIIAIYIWTIILLSCEPTKQTEDSVRREQFDVKCYSREIVMDPEFDSDVLDSCLYKDIITVSRGTPDYKGRYFYTYKLYLNRKDSLLQIKNHLVFKNIAHLEDSLNLFVMKEFDELHSQSAERFSDFELRHYNIDEFGLELKDSSMIFNLSFGLPSSCLAVNGVTIKYRLKNLTKHLK